jgi:hypothetical protein
MPPKKQKSEGNIGNFSTLLKRGRPPAQPPTRIDDPNLALHCWILGDPHREAFEVRIPRNENVHGLKCAIKTQSNELTNLPAKSLILYEVSIPYGPGLADDVNALQPNERELDHPFRILSAIFPNDLPADHVHVVVKTPSRA